jgi:hypothetical protein
MTNLNNYADTVYSIVISKKEEDLLELFGLGVTDDEIQANIIIEIIQMHYQLLEMETHYGEDEPFHNLRRWIFKNLAIIVEDEGYIDPTCDTDVEEILKKFTWVIKYLVQIHLMIKKCLFDDKKEIEKFMRKMVGLFKFDIYLCDRTDSKVELSNLISEAVEINATNRPSSF